MSTQSMLKSGTALWRFDPNMRRGELDELTKKLAQRRLQHIDRSQILGHFDMLVWGVVQAGVAGAIGQDGTAPGWADDVHIRGAGLEEKAGRATRRAHTLEESAHQRIVLVAPVRLAAAAETQQAATCLACQLVLKHIRLDPRRKADADRQLGPVGQPVAARGDRAQRG